MNSKGKNTWFSSYATNCYHYVDPDINDNNYDTCESTNDTQKTRLKSKLKQNSNYGKQLTLFDF